MSFLWKKEQQKLKVPFLQKRNNKNASAVPLEKEQQNGQSYNANMQKNKLDVHGIDAKDELHFE